MDHKVRKVEKVEKTKCYRCGCTDLEEIQTGYGIELDCNKCGTTMLAK